jgi:hypothetical protein
MELDERPAKLRLTVHELEAILLKQGSTRAESSQLLPTVDECSNPLP